MQAIVTPGDIDGIVQAPASKSMTQRAYAAALLHHGTSKITGSGNSNDEQAALAAIQHLGATVTKDGDTLIVYSQGPKAAQGIINIAESGLAARLLIPIAALTTGQLTVTGHGSIMKRPMTGVQAALEALGVHLQGHNGYLPVVMQGPMQPRNITIDAAGGSQLVSGLLMALSYAATAPLTLTVKQLKSIPYIDLTLLVLAHFGRPITHDRYERFYIDPAAFQYKDPINIAVEGDWSAAANILTAAAIAGKVTVTGLDADSQQADRAILDVLRNCGAHVRTIATGVEVQQADALRAFELDATHCPDLFPIAAILAAHCKGASHIKGLHRLHTKESNRVESTTAMLHKFGIAHSIEEDSLIVTGGRQLKGNITIDGYNDHRIVMAAAVAALTANGPVTITGSEAVNKSYPEFFNTLSLCGIQCTTGI